MIITHPEPGAKPPLWLAQLQDSDCPTPALMREQMEKYGLNLSDTYSGTNESVYLAAAAGATLGTALNFVGKVESSRIDVNNLGHHNMRHAALLDLTSAGSYYEFAGMLKDFTACRDWFSEEDYEYLVLYYCQLTKVANARRWVAHVVELERIAGNSGILPEEVIEHVEDLIEGFPREPGFEVPLVEALHLLLTQFNGSELMHLMRDVPLKDGELRIIALLRREIGPDADVDTLVSELRSMKPSWLNSLLA